MDFGSAYIEDQQRIVDFILKRIEQSKPYRQAINELIGELAQGEDILPYAISPNFLGVPTLTYQFKGVESFKDADLMSLMGRLLALGAVFTPTVEHAWDVSRTYPGSLEFQGLAFNIDVLASAHRDSAHCQRVVESVEQVEYTSYRIECT